MLIDPAECDESTPQPHVVMYSIVPGMRAVTAGETYLISCGLHQEEQHQTLRTVEQLL